MVLHPPFPQLPELLDKDSMVCGRTTSIVHGRCEIERSTVSQSQTMHLQTPII